MILPILIIFIYVELNKESFSRNINKIKSDIFKLNTNVGYSKIFVTILMIINLIRFLNLTNQKSNKVDQFLSYEIQNKKIKDAVFSDNLYMNNSDLLTNSLKICFLTKMNLNTENQIQNYLKTLKVFGMIILK